MRKYFAFTSFVARANAKFHRFKVTLSLFTVRKTIVHGSFGHFKWNFFDRLLSVSYALLTRLARDFWVVVVVGRLYHVRIYSHLNRVHNFINKIIKSKAIAFELSMPCFLLLFICGTVDIEANPSNKGKIYLFVFFCHHFCFIVEINFNRQKNVQLVNSVQTAILILFVINENFTNWSA